jgi:hypothetical protein
MNKKVLVTVLVLAVAMLTLPISAVFAVSPIIEVSGTITSIPTSITMVKTVGENTFIYITTASTWNGDIDGSTVGSQTWIVHAGGGKPPHITTNVELTFTTLQSTEKQEP